MIKLKKSDGSDDLRLDTSTVAAYSRSGAETQIYTTAGYIGGLADCTEYLDSIFFGHGLKDAVHPKKLSGQAQRMHLQPTIDSAVVRELQAYAAQNGIGVDGAVEQLLTRALGFE